MTYTTHDLVDEYGGKANVKKDKVKVAPVNLIKGLCEVNLKDGGFELFCFDRVQGFLSSTNSLMDLSMVKE